LIGAQTGIDQLVHHHRLRACAREGIVGTVAVANLCGGCRL
jgi:hypothetical protein